MFGYISRQTSSLVAQPRRDVTLDALGALPSSGGTRQMLGRALVAIGQRVAGEMPAGRAPQPDGECA